MASAKQRYTQLMEWLEVRKQNNTKTTKAPTRQNFSKADTYNSNRR